MFAPRLLARCAVAFALVFSLIGCGGGKGTVRGKVTHGGKAVVWGSVTLVDETGMYHDGFIDLNGNYEIENVPVGPVKIAVTSPSPDPPRERGAAAGQGKGRGAPIPGGRVKGNVEDPREKFLAGKDQVVDGRPRPPAGAWFPIPDKFRDVATSGLTGEVKNGETIIDIDLK